MIYNYMLEEEERRDWERKEKDRQEREEGSDYTICIFA